MTSKNAMVDGEGLRAIEAQFQELMQRPVWQPPKEVDTPLQQKGGNTSSTKYGKRVSRKHRHLQQYFDKEINKLLDNIQPQRPSGPQSPGNCQVSDVILQTIKT